MTNTERPARIARPESWRHRFIAKNEGRCHYCNRSGSLDMGPGGRPWHIDHKHPIALGGEDSEDNLALACKRCNLAKNVKPYDRFVAVARAAYWQPHDGEISEAELDDIMDDWKASFDRLDNRDDRWRIGDDCKSVVIGEDNYVSHVMMPVHDEKRAINALRFAVAAHRMIPRLVGEIRHLRGKLAELSPEQSHEVAA